MSEKVYVGSRVKSMKKGREYEPFSRVTMWYDDEHYYTAGDDSGRELKLECPWAKQGMVDNILAEIKGYVYRPFEASGAVLDPAFELGDAVTVGGVYTVIAHAKENFDAMGATDISAPGENEVDHEYPYESPRERELKRRVKLEQKYYGAKISRREGLVIEKTDGETVSAKAVLNADELSFYDAGGGRVLYFDPTTGTYKFLGELNVNDKFVVDRAGNVVMAGGIRLSGNINFSDAGAITWGENAPTKKRFSESASGPWHSDMQSSDKWRQDWDYASEKWGEAYQFRGEDGADGRPGSDATVPKYITQTVISKGVIEAPQIKANDFGVYPSSKTDYKGSFNIYGQHLSSQHHFFQIGYQGQKVGSTIPPRVEMYSPEGAGLYIAGGAGSGSGTLFLGKTYGYDPIYQTVMLCGKIDLSEGDIVDWGNNYPVAVLG